MCCAGEVSQGPLLEKQRELEQKLKDNVSEMLRQRNRAIKLHERVESLVEGDLATLPGQRETEMRWLVVGPLCHAWLPWVVVQAFLVPASGYVVKAIEMSRSWSHFCTSLAGQIDGLDVEELADELISQSKAYDTMWDKFMAVGIQMCSSTLADFSAEWESAAKARSKPAGSSRSGANCSAGHCNGSAAATGADSSSARGMPSKAQVSQPSTSRKGAQQMPSQLFDQGAMGHPVPDISGRAAPASMTAATAKTRAVQSPPAEGAAQGLTRQDRSTRHGEGSSPPDMNDIPGLIAWAKERMAEEDKAAQAGNQKAAPKEAPEQSELELAAQEAKQARKQAKRARQRARKAQGTAAGADGKVCSCLCLCVTSPCLAKLKGCILCESPVPGVR